MLLTTAAGGRIEYERIPGARRGRRSSCSTRVSAPSRCGGTSREQVADATGHEVVVYSRQGYGRSAPLQRAARPCGSCTTRRWSSCPRSWTRSGIRRPILLGHSDGGSIAIIHAGGSGREVAGLVLLAPHVMVEDISVASIAAARTAYAQGALRARLGAIMTTWMGPSAAGTTCGYGPSFAAGR